MISRKVLVTPTVLFAFTDRNHPRHSEASAFFRYFAQEKFHVFVTSFSIAKTYDQIKKHTSFSIAKDFLRIIYTGNIEIVYPDEVVTKAALKLLLTNTGVDLGLEHALINVIADRKQISQIAAFEYNNFYFGIQQFSLPY
ncbi:hypothetical protein HY440_02885 [Candidatus Microgenomates bacterium]|nr:hypothetical protein [Candidatus Microgenomates bacterium]